MDDNIKTMSRKASDNKYLHKDFHQSMNILMDYIYRNFGEEQLKRYLKQYAEAYYKIIKQKMKKGDIIVLMKYFTNLYEKEEWNVKIISNNDKIEIVQESCPGITHIKNMRGRPCVCYKETYKTIYTTLCEGTPFEYSLEYFDEETGACKQIFKRKEIIE